MQKALSLLMQRSDDQLKRQIQYILEQLNSDSSEDAQSDNNEDYDDDEDDQDEFEGEEDPTDEVIEV